MKRHVSHLISVLTLALVLAGCSAAGNTPAEKRRNVDNMARQVLQRLYAIKPDAKAQIASAPGYAVFSNANVNLLLVSAGGGYGVVVNNRTGEKTYMKMAEAGIGFGAGVKDFRAVFVFHDPLTLDKFINNGWSFGGNADVAAKASDKGAAVGGELVIDNITIYQITEAGLALQATLKGTRYWKDEALNRK
jgi:lipid-binding SYLF domain-containing protein